MSVTFDTHKQFKNLTAAGFTEQQAETIVYMLVEICAKAQESEINKEDINGLVRTGYILPSKTDYQKSRPE
jgi:hypothetical protein